MGTVSNFTGFVVENRSDKFSNSWFPFTRHLQIAPRCQVDPLSRHRHNNHNKSLPLSLSTLHLIHTFHPGIKVNRFRQTNRQANPQTQNCINQLRHVSEMRFPSLILKLESACRAHLLQPHLPGCNKDSVSVRGRMSLLLTREAHQTLHLQ